MADDITSWIIRAATAARDAVAWAPDWVVGVVLAAVAAVLAVAAHAALERLAVHLIHKREVFWASFIPRTRGLFRGALVLLAVNLVSQSPLFPQGLSDLSVRIISLAVILLLGLAVMAAIDVGAAYHLRRYKIDVADNLLARKHLTQMRIIKQALRAMVLVMTIAAGLMSFESVRQFGVSLFASAGAAGLVVGLAARPVLSNLIAGLQIAVSQPIRIDDVVTVEGEFGNIEEITGSFVVIRLWDLRRLVVPLSYFIEKPFQNYTRMNAALVGTVTFQLDYSVPVDAFRAEAEKIVRSSKLWNGSAVNVQVTDFKDNVVELRVLLTAKDSSDLWDMRCEVREKLLAYLKTNHPASFRRFRVEAVDLAQDGNASDLRPAGPAKPAALPLKKPN